MKKESYLNESVNNTLSKEVIDEIRDECQFLNDNPIALDKNKEIPKEHSAHINIENNRGSNNFEAEKWLSWLTGTS